jgi:GDP-L-fucose synthase
VRRLLYLGSSCIYPRDCPQPMKEEYLLTGPLEPTNRAYAIAKIAGIETCWSYNRQYGTRFLAAMPTNLFGPQDNYDLLDSHVLPALIRKAHEAKARGDSELVVWGTGRPRREFMYSDDMAEACVFLLTLDEERFGELVRPAAAPLINIGTGKDLTVAELAALVCEVVGFRGRIVQDTARPDGTPRKLLDVSKLQALGWHSRVSLREGIERAYEDFRQRR